MGVPEGHTLKDKIFSNIGSQDQSVPESSVRSIFIHLDLHDQSRENREYSVQAVYSPEQGTLVVLQVTVVCERYALCHCKEIHQGAVKLS